MRSSSEVSRKGEPLGTSRISAPWAFSSAQGRGPQMSSQTGTPRVTPRWRKAEVGPGSKMRFSSNTP